MTASLPHLHLVLNHVPTIGLTVALALLILGFVRRHEPLKHVALELLFIIAIVAMPAFMTGVAARVEIRDMPGVSALAMRRHYDAALSGFTVTEIAGFVAWVALWQARRRGRTNTATVAVVLLLSFASLALMGLAANIGGEIRHPEIMSAAPAPEEPASADPSAIPPADDPARFVTAAISDVMVNSPWVWPAAEAVHFLGLALTFGVLLTVNLRVLGVMQQVAFGDLHRLLPWGMLGFGANFVTGMMFFIGQPRQYLESAPFYWKVGLMMIAGANFLYLTVFKRAWEGERFDATFGDKAMAASSIVVWLAVLYAGRMLPFLGKAF